MIFPSRFADTWLSLSSVTVASQIWDLIPWGLNSDHHLSCSPSWASHPLHCFSPGCVDSLSGMASCLLCSSHSSLVKPSCNARKPPREQSFLHVCSSCSPHCCVGTAHAHPNAPGLPHYQQMGFSPKWMCQKMEAPPKCNFTKNTTIFFFTAIFAKGWMCFLPLEYAECCSTFPSIFGIIFKCTKLFHLIVWAGRENFCMMSTLIS